MFLINLIIKLFQPGLGRGMLGLGRAAALQTLKKKSPPASGQATPVPPAAPSQPAAPPQPAVVPPQPAVPAPTAPSARPTMPPPLGKSEFIPEYCKPFQRRK